MPTSGKKPDPLGGDLAILIGQLLATTEAASSGIKSLSDETSANSRAIIAAATTLGMVEKTVSDMVRMVRDGNGQESLIAQMKGLKILVEQLRTTITELNADSEETIKRIDVELAALRADVDAYKQDRQHHSGGQNMLIVVCVVVGWLVTTIVAIYAAIGQWNSGGGKP